VTVSWFGPQNQVGFGLSVVSQNQRNQDGAGHASRSGGLLRLEASCARVSQSGLKTDGDATVGGHVAPSWRLCRDQVEDGWVDAMGCVGPCYPYFSVFYVLGPKGIVVF
jgi:hypothetical protein